MASLVDILTAAKNVVTAINNVAGTYLNVQGSQNIANISTASLIKIGSGRVASISVTTAGTTTGLVYDTNSASSTSNPIYVIPNTIGVTFVNLPVTNGIVVAVGTGQIVTISFS